MQNPTPVQSPENTVAPDEDVSVTVVPFRNGVVHLPVTPYCPAPHEMPAGELVTENETGAVQYCVQCWLKWKLQCPQLQAQQYEPQTY